MKIIFTFKCSEIGTGDFLDPEIEVNVMPGRHMFQRALQLALEAFDREYADRMEIVNDGIVVGRL